MVNRETIAEKIQQFHNEHNGGKIPVYDGVVVMDSTLSTNGQDVEVITIVFVADNNVDDIKHLTLEAGIKLVDAIDALFDQDDDEEDDEDDSDEFDDDDE